MLPYVSLTGMEAMLLMGRPNDTLLLDKYKDRVSCQHKTVLQSLIHGVLMLTKAMMSIYVVLIWIHKGFAQDGGEFHFDASFVCCDPDCPQVHEPCEAA